MQDARRVHRRNPNFALVIVGAGLVLVGAALFFMLPRSGEGRPAASQVLTIPAEVSYPAPELSLNDLDGNPVSLAQLRGQVVLVNLWATWCPPCKKEMPALQAYYQAHNAAGFVVVAVNDGDPAADVAQFVRDYGLTFPVWLDPAYVATEKAFQTLNLPSSFVIDRQGMVRLRWVGEATPGMLEQYVTPILAEEPKAWMPN
ncbi:MAG: redoxin domain-containing protein [Bacteroidota bacterium]